MSRHMHMWALACEAGATSRHWKRGVRPKFAMSVLMPVLIPMRVPVLMPVLMPVLTLVLMVGSLPVSFHG